MQLMHRRLVGLLRGEHMRLLRRQAALAQIARRAGRHDVFPGRLPAFRARKDMIERKIAAGTAILAGEPVAQEDVETRERRMRGRFDERFQRDRYLLRQGFQQYCLRRGRGPVAFTTAGAKVYKV